MRPDTNHTAADVIAAVRISNVYEALTGAKPRRAGLGKFRARAVYRDGDGPSLSLDDSRGVWHDFVTGESGGVLALVERIRGGSRQEALRWVADFAGMPLEEKAFSPAEQAEWVKKREELERDLPDARLWQRAAINMAEDLLVTLKAALFDPKLPPPGTFEIFDVEQMLARLRRIDDAELVAEHRWWQEYYPGMTAAMVRAVKARERTEERVLRGFLRQRGRGVQAA
jgi:hypothetical protein